MPLPNDFQAVIKEEYGNFGWELANTFSFIAEYLGYKVYDISAVETALKIIATEHGSSLITYGHPTNFSLYMNEYYPKVHKAFTRRAKAINVSDKTAEDERKKKAVQNFVDYAIGSNLSMVQMLMNDFYKNFIMTTLTANVHLWFGRIEKKINEQNDN